jgi:hypothetical protein
MYYILQFAKSSSRLSVLLPYSIDWIVMEVNKVRASNVDIEIELMTSACISCSNIVIASIVECAITYSTGRSV